MFKFNIKINYLLFIAAVFLSFSFSYQELLNSFKREELNYQNLILAISNIGISLIFFFNIFQSKVSKFVFGKITWLFLTIIMCLYIGSALNDTTHNGFREGRMLAYQILTFIFGVSIFFELLRQRKLYIFK